MSQNQSVELAAQHAFSATIGRGAVAVTGTSPDSGASQVARAMAAVGANFGRRTLLIRAVPAVGAPEPRAADVDSVRAAATEVRPRLYEVEAPVGTDLHVVLNDSKRLTDAFAEWAWFFDGIVVDCPAYGEATPPLFTPMTAAAADAVILVGLSGAMPRAIFETVLRWLSQSGATLSALVLNDRHNPTLAHEIIRESRRLRRVLPWLPGFVARRVAAVPALNRLR